MFFAPNPAVLAAGVGGGRTYAEWQAEANRLSLDGALPWSSNSAKPTGRFRSTPEALGSANLWGSSWMAPFAYDSSTARIVQHGVATQSMFDVILSGGFVVYFEIVQIGIQNSFTALNRNGFLSRDYGEYTGARCVDLIVWDGVQAWRNNPYAGTAPAIYDWVI